MRKKFLAALAAFLTVFGIGIAAASSASAGTCTVIGGISACGRVYNSGAYNVLVTDNWPGGTGHVYTLSPGYWSPFKDTDGFFVPSGMCFDIWRGPQWVKINDLTIAHVALRVC